MVRMTTRVLPVARRIGTPIPAVPDDALNAHLFGVLDQVVGEGIAGVVVGLSHHAFTTERGNVDVEGATRRVHRHLQPGGLGARRADEADDD